MSQGIVDEKYGNVDRVNQNRKIRKSVNAFINEIKWYKEIKKLNPDENFLKKY